jgi:hypothetical protein
MTLRLSIDAQGQKNWDIKQPPKSVTPQTTETSPPAPTPSAHMVVNAVLLKDSTVFFTDARTNRKETLTLSNLQLNRQDKGYDLALDGTLREQPLSLSGNVENVLALTGRGGQSAVTLKTSLGGVAFDASAVITTSNGAVVKTEGALTLNAPTWPKNVPEIPALPPVTLKTGFLYTPESLTWTDAHLDSLGASLIGNGMYRFDGGAFDTALKVNSPGSLDLAQQFQIPLLQNPFSLKGRLQKKGDMITWSKLNITLGQSTVMDSEGNLRLPEGAKVPTLLQADARSPLIVLADLKAPALPPAPAAPLAAPLPAASPVTPTTPEATPQPAPAPAPVFWRNQSVYDPAWSQLRGVVTASVDHVRETVKSPDLLTQATVRINSQDTLRLDAKAGFAGSGLARIEGTLTPQPQTPALDAAIALVLDVTHPSMGDLLKTIGATAAAQGGVTHLAANLKGAGVTVQNVLETLTGDVVLGMGPATIQSDAVLSSFISADLARAVLADQKTLQISCLATRWPFVQGTARTPITLLESTAARVSGTGSLNLAQNTMAMTITPTPKDAKLTALAVPLSIAGPLNAPKVTLDKQSLDSLAGTVFSLIQNKGKLPTAPLAANDDLCSQVLIPLKGGRFEVRGVSLKDSPSAAPTQTKPASGKELLKGLKGLWR